MNRIYQGRVSKVQRLKAGAKHELEPFDANDLERDRQLGEDALWNHHVVYQDAVNYYTLALVALGADLPEGHPICELSKRMEAAWDVFPRKTTTPARCLRDSLQQWLGLGRDSTFDEALKAVLPATKISGSARSLAVALLAQRTREMKPQKAANTYWVRFCDVLDKLPNWDYSRDELARKTGSASWISALWADDAANSILALSASVRLSSVVKCVPNAKDLTEAEGRALVSDALNHLRSVIERSAPDSKPARRTNEWLRSNERLVREFLTEAAELVNQVATESLCKECPRGGGIDINKTHAVVLLKAFPRRFVMDYIRQAVPQPKAKKSVTKAEGQDAVVANDDVWWREAERQIVNLGDDPIQMARVDGSPIFSAFTALSRWVTNNGRAGWSDFDRAAFEEALKTINQFTLKTKERTERRAEVKAELDFMLGENADWTPSKKSEEDDDRTVPVIKGDPRYDKLLALLKDLGEGLEEKSAEDVIGPTHASLRGYRKLRDVWIDLWTKAGGKPAVSVLVDAVGDLQREHKLDMGYTAFYHKLCEEAYWELWLEPTTEARKDQEIRGFARSVIHAAADARELAEEHQALLEPIRYTPAEPEYSRRLFMFSDMGGVHGEKYCDDGVDVSIVLKTPNGYAPCRVHLSYAAPRLQRDELDGGAQDARWLQPMMQALDLKPEERAHFTRDKDGKAKTKAIALMPAFIGRQRERRLLLNFPVDLDTTAMVDKLGKEARWHRQFNAGGKPMQRFHLLWPKVGKQPDAPWWLNEKVREKGFHCLSIDLGQRRGADYAVLHAVPRKTAKAFVALGEAGGLNWHAELRAQGSLRLPGEDVKVFRALAKDGKGDKRGLKQELSGSRGRLGDADEWLVARNLATALLHDENQFALNEKVSNWIGDQHGKLSVPEQNDSLVKLLHGAISRYRTWQRWSWRLNSKHSSLHAKTLKEIVQVPYFAEWATLAKEGKAELLQAKVLVKCGELRQSLQAHLQTLANRLLPLRGKSWRLVDVTPDSTSKPLHRLISDGAAQASEPMIMGHRGISVKRIEQLDGFRRAVLSLNRLLRHEKLDEKPEFGRATRGDVLPDPCEEITDKLVRLKEERVNQTAHLIIAQALGVRLKDPALSGTHDVGADVHGTYEPIPGRMPVDFICLEDLSRYKTDRSRAKSENSRLMNWCHRQLNAKVAMLAEPFGIPVLEVFASYSSRFDSKTGAPGFRAAEVEADDRRFWTKAIEKEPLAKDTFATLDELKKQGAGHLRLLVPKHDGALFLAAVPGSANLPTVRQADVNAAINIGLRAIAGPTCYHAHPRVRIQRAGTSGMKGTRKRKTDAAASEPKMNAWTTRRDNAREKAQFTKAEKVTFTNLSADSDALKGDHVTLFHDPHKIGRFGQACIEGVTHPQLCHSSAIFSKSRNERGEPIGAVARLEWEVCQRINAARIAAWKAKKEGADEIPL